MAQTHHRPKPPKTTYRLQVFCWAQCRRPQTFKLDTGHCHWACCECQFVELTPEGALAPDPWVRR